MARGAPRSAAVGPLGRRWPLGLACAMVSYAVATTALGLLVAHCSALIANKVAQTCIPSEQVLDGFKRWRWILSCWSQVFVFPVLVAASWFCRPAGVNFMEYFALSASASSVYGRWYVYALFAAQTRDLPMPAATSTVLKVHHWLVVVACCFALLAPSGFGLFIGGTFVLETGSLLYNMRKLYPASTIIRILYHVCMTSSNAIAVFLGVYVLLGLKGFPVWMKAIYLAADFGVCIGRQHAALKDLGLLGKKAKNATAVAIGGSGASSSSAADLGRGSSTAAGAMRPAGEAQCGRGLRGRRSGSRGSSVGFLGRGLMSAGMLCLGRRVFGGHQLGVQRSVVHRLAEAAQKERLRAAPRLREAPRYLALAGRAVNSLASLRAGL